MAERHVDARYPSGDRGQAVLTVAGGLRHDDLLLAREGAGEAALDGVDARVAPADGDLLVAAAENQPVPLVRRRVDGRRVGVESVGEEPAEQGELLVEVPLLVEEALQAVAHTVLEIPDPVVVEPEVLVENRGDLGGERLEDPEVVLSETLAPLVGVDVENAEQTLSREQGTADRRHDIRPFPLVERPRSGGDVADDPCPLLLGRFPGDPLADPLPRAAYHLGTQPGCVSDVHLVGALGEEHDRSARRSGRPDGDLEQPFQQALAVGDPVEVLEGLLEVHRPGRPFLRGVVPSGRPVPAAGPARGEIAHRLVRIDDPAPGEAQDLYLVREFLTVLGDDDVVCGAERLDEPLVREYRDADDLRDLERDGSRIAIVDGGDPVFRVAVELADDVQLVEPPAEYGDCRLFRHVAAPP